MVRILLFSIVSLTVSVAHGGQVFLSMNEISVPPAPVTAKTVAAVAASPKRLLVPKYVAPLAGASLGLDQQLLIAMGHGKKAAVRSLLRSGASLVTVAKGEDGGMRTYNALFYANGEMRQFLNEVAGSKRQSSLIAPSLDPNLLRQAVLAQDVPRIRELLRRGADVNARIAVGRDLESREITVVWDAMAGESEDVLRILIQEGGADLFRVSGHFINESYEDEYASAFDVGSQRMRNYVLKLIGAPAPAKSGV